MALSTEADSLLATVAEMTSWGCYADSIPAAGELVTAGYIRAEDDYEGPRLIITDKGMKAALRRKLIAMGEDGRYRIVPPANQ